MRTCAYCLQQAIPDSARSDARFCSGRCRVNAHRHGGSERPRFIEYQLRPAFVISKTARTGFCAVCTQPLIGQRRVVCSKKCSNRLNRFARRGRQRGALRERYTVMDLVNRDSLRCGICEEGIDLAVSYPNPLSPSIDHIIPLSRGGDDILENVQLAHLRCNLSKGSSMQ